MTRDEKDLLLRMLTGHRGAARWPVASKPFKRLQRKGYVRTEHMYNGGRSTRTLGYLTPAGAGRAAQIALQHVEPTRPIAYYVPRKQRNNPKYKFTTIRRKYDLYGHLVHDE